MHGEIRSAFLFPSRSQLIAARVHINITSRSRAPLKPITDTFFFNFLLESVYCVSAQLGVNYPDFELQGRRSVRSHTHESLRWPAAHRTS